MKFQFLFSGESRYNVLSIHLMFVLDNVMLMFSPTSLLLRPCDVLGRADSGALLF